MIGITNDPITVISFYPPGMRQYYGAEGDARNSGITINANGDKNASDRVEN